MTHTDLRRPRILYITPVCDLGGEELSTLSLAVEVAGRGYDVALVTEGGDFLDEFVSAGIPTHVLPMNARRPAGIWRASRALRELLDATPFDILHSQEVFTTVIAHLARRLPTGTGSKLIYHYRGVRPRMIPSVARVLPRISDYVLTNAETNRTLFLERGIDPASVRTIYNGLDFSDFDVAYDRAEVRSEWGVPDDAFVVGAIGRLHPVKGHAVLIDALSHVRRERDDVHAVLIGDGPLRSELEARVAAAGLASVVHFRGVERNVARCLAGLDLLVLPSTEEAIGRVLAEAHAVGLPAIASRVGGTGEIVRDGVSGFLVSPGDPAALAGRILDIARDPERARAFGVAGKRWVRERFGLQAMVDDTLEIYHRLFDRTDTRSPRP